MKVGIIGGTSFIAQNLIHVLSPDYSLYIWGRSQSTIKKPQRSSFYKYDYPEFPIAKHELLAMDVIICCMGAGVQPNHSANVEDIFEINAFEPIRLLSYLSLNGFSGKVITFGSYFEIGENSVEKNYGEVELEEVLPTPLNDYCVSKRLLTRFIGNFLQKNPIQLFHFILPNIYGKTENSNRLIPYVVSSLKKGSNIALSNGDQKRQYVHIQDIVSLINNLLEEEAVKSGIFCLSAKKAVSVREIVKKCVRIALAKGYSAGEIKFNETKKRDEGAKYLGLDSSKAERELNWSPKITLEDGIDSYF